MYNSTSSCGIHWPHNSNGYYRSLLLTDADVQRIADAVVKKLDERAIRNTTKSDDIELPFCIQCQQPKDSPGHELGCDIGRKDYGHED